MDNEILRLAIENGMIDLQEIECKLEMKKRQELLAMHPYKIWQGTDGKWHTYLPDKERGRISRKRSNKREMEDLICAFWEKTVEDPSVSEIFEEWNNRRLQLQQISKSTHLRNQQIFNRHYDEFGKNRIRSVTPEKLIDFLEEQIAAHQLTSKGFSNLKGITRGMFKRARRRELITFIIENVLLELDVSEKCFRKVMKEDVEEVFDEEEMDIMMRYLSQHLDMQNLGIMLMFVTGIRIGELVALKRCDFGDSFIDIRRTETRYRNETGNYVCEVREFPKTMAGWRTVIIPEEYVWLLRRIERIDPFSEYVFSEQGVRVTAQAVRMKLKRICRKLGVHHKSPHKIRKTYGSILLDNHVDNKLIMGQMGHTDILCTENHYHRNRRSLEKKREILSDLPEFKKSV